MDHYRFHLLLNFLILLILEAHLFNIQIIMVKVKYAQLFHALICAEEDTKDLSLKSDGLLIYSCLSSFSSLSAYLSI